MVRRRLPLHRRLQRQVHQVHAPGAPTTSVTPGAGTARARRGSTATCDQRGQLLQRFPLRPVQHPGKPAAVGSTAGWCRAWRPTRGTTAPRPRSAATPRPSTARPTCRAWGPMEKLYTAMGGQRSYLKASTGPIRDTRDRTAKYVTYQGGRIWWTSATGAVGDVVVHARALRRVRRPGQARLPEGRPATGLTDGGWMQLFQKGCHRRQRLHLHPLRVRLALDHVGGQRSRAGAAGLPPRRAGAAHAHRLDPGVPEGLHRRQHLHRRAIVHDGAWTAWVATGRESRPARLPDGRPRHADVAAAPRPSSAAGCGRSPAGRRSPSGAPCSRPGSRRVAPTAATASPRRTSSRHRRHPDRCVRGRHDHRLALRRSRGAQGAGPVRVTNGDGARIEPLQHRDRDPPARAHRPRRVAGGEPPRQRRRAGRLPARASHRAASGRRAAPAARPALLRRARRP